MKLLPSIFLMVAAVLQAGCTGEVPPASCDGKNLRAVKDLVLSRAPLPQVSSLTEALSHRNCNDQTASVQP